MPDIYMLKEKIHFGSQIIEALDHTHVVLGREAGSGETVHDMSSKRQ